MSENSSVKLNTIFAQKAGMTRIFSEDGRNVPVTVLKFIPNKVVQVKTNEKDGYEALQIGFGAKREKLITAPVKGHLKKADINEAFSRFVEVPYVEGTQAGSSVELDSIDKGSYVDITGFSKGKGFAGVMKRHGFQGGPAAHGSKFHRTTGSIGNRATPGRVFKLKKMPGQMGNKKCTVQNLKIVDVNLSEGFMLILGSVPGPKNGFVKVSKSIKK